MHASLFAPLFLAAPTFGSAADWNHGFGATSEMTFADFNSNKLLTDQEAEFVAGKYRVISLEKCTGIGSGVQTEEAIYSTAQRLKKIDPTLKVLFYFATDQQGLQCYNASAEYMAHPEFWLKDDHGNIVRAGGVPQGGSKGGIPLLDVANPAAAAWWASIPLKGTDGAGNYKGTPVSQLIDGVLADSAGWERYAAGNISVARLEALEDAKFQMLSTLQQSLIKANGHGIVMANGISMYGGANADPRHPGGFNRRVLGFTNAVMNEHTAVFESVNSKNASFNVQTVADDLSAMIEAAHESNGTKLVFVQTWPGLYVSTAFTPKGSTPAHVYPPVANGGEPSPQTNADWRNELRTHFTFAHALFLSIAEANMYWMYGGWWYPSNTGYIACPDDLNSCPAPPEWYPALNKPLGAPLGARVEVAPYVWTRHFEHATVHLDLNNPKASSVTFASDFTETMVEKMVQ